MRSIHVLISAINTNEVTKCRVLLQLSIRRDREQWWHNDMRYTLSFRFCSLFGHSIVDFDEATIDNWTIQCLFSEVCLPTVLNSDKSKALRSTFVENYFLVDHHDTGNRLVKIKHDDDKVTLTDKLLIITYVKQILQILVTVAERDIADVKSSRSALCRFFLSTLGDVFVSGRHRVRSYCGWLIVGFLQGRSSWCSSVARLTRSVWIWVGITRTTNIRSYKLIRRRRMCEV